MATDTEYMRVYMLRRYHARMRLARARLGNLCNRCGSSDGVECDHVDRTTKLFTVGGGWNRPLAVFLAEVDKCQLLCAGCHQLKGREVGDILPESAHGTVNRYQRWKCRCPECRTAMAVCNRESRYRCGTRVPGRRRGKNKAV